MFAKHPRHAIEKLRADLRDLRIKRDEIARAPLPVAHALEQLDDFLDDQRKQAFEALQLDSFTREGAALRVRWPTPTVQLAPGVTAPSVAQHIPALAALAVAAGGEALRDMLTAELENLYGAMTIEPLHPAEKAEALRRADREALAIEAAEELAIRAAEADGIAILRRADVDPRIALAPDTELTQLTAG